jgi:hypothetical protein
MVCNSCQRNIADGSRFCYNCGARQVVTDAPNMAAATGGPKRLMRSSTDKKIGGVCAGVPDFGASVVGAGSFLRRNGHLAVRDLVAGAAAGAPASVCGSDFAGADCAATRKLGVFQVAPARGKFIS